MGFAMTPCTPEGQYFVDQATALIPTLRDQADARDRGGEISPEPYRALQDKGIPAAFVPQALGGMGLSSAQDWLAGIATLARGDASVAIAINMHLGVSRGLSQAYSAAVAQGHTPEGVSVPLKAIAEAKMLICATATERGTDNLHPQTLAQPCDDGLRIDGHKMFVTMSPVATHIGMNLRLQHPDGDKIGTVLLPIDAPGIEPQNDWDALGMRASGSQSIAFNNVLVPTSAVRPLGPWGQWSTNMLINRTIGNLPLVAAFLGIAEHAHELALAALGTQKRLGEPVNAFSGVQHLVGEMEIELATCQSILQQAGRIADEFFSTHEQQSPSIEQAHELMKHYQCAKTVVNQGAINIVNKAMDLVGGGGFMSENPLTRLYRDVRAGPFMQPFAPTELKGYVGKVALGQYPTS